MPIPQKENAVVRTTAKERVYQTLQQWIIDGTLLPGERLNDNELAKYFAVSRTPVREALQMLTEQNLLTVVPSSGTYVAPIVQEDMVLCYDLLAELQSYAVSIAIHKITEEQLTELHKINERFMEQITRGVIADVIRSDWDFHHYLAELSGNHYLVSYTDQLMIQAHRNEFQFFKANGIPTDSYQEHEGIIQALRDGNLEQAKGMVSHNWEVSVSA